MNASFSMQVRKEEYRKSMSWFSMSWFAPAIPLASTLRRSICLYIKLKTKTKSVHMINFSRTHINWSLVHLDLFLRTHQYNISPTNFYYTSGISTGFLFYSSEFTRQLHMFASLTASRRLRLVALQLQLSIEGSRAANLWKFQANSNRGRLVGMA